MIDKRANEVKPIADRVLFGSMEYIFQSRLDEIEARAQACGLTLTHLCRDVEMSRATPDRWRADTPLSVKLIDKLEAVVVRAERTSGITK